MNLILTAQGVVQWGLIKRVTNLLVSYNAWNFLISFQRIILLRGTRLVITNIPLVLWFNK
jgi:hypothetical protein